MFILQSCWFCCEHKLHTHPHVHTDTHFSLTPTEEIWLSSSTQHLGSQLEVPRDCAEDSLENASAVLLIQLMEYWLFYIYACTLTSPKMGMTKVTDGAAVKLKQ